MSITDNLGFYIGNPGTHVRRHTAPAGIHSLPRHAAWLHSGYCRQLPQHTFRSARSARRSSADPPLRRAEFRSRQARHRQVVRHSLLHLQQAAPATTPGLTNTDPTDGGGGRHAPEQRPRVRPADHGVHCRAARSTTVRSPPTVRTPPKVFGYYRLKWAHMETNLGVTQTPSRARRSARCLPVVGTSSACQWAEGRGNFC